MHADTFKFTQCKIHHKLTFQNTNNLVGLYLTFSDWPPTISLTSYIYTKPGILKTHIFVRCQLGVVSCQNMSSMV